MDREVDLEFEGSLRLCYELPRSRRTQDCKRAGILHLCPEHDHAGYPQAVIGVQMGYGDKLQPAHSQPRFLPVNLRPFPGVEKI